MPRWFLQVLTNPCFRAALSVIGLGVLAVVDSFQLGLFSQTHFHNLQNVVLLDLVCSSLTFFFSPSIAMSDVCCSVVMKFMA